MGCRGPKWYQVEITGKNELRTPPVSQPFPRRKADGLWTALVLCYCSATLAVINEVSSDWHARNKCVPLAREVTCLWLCVITVVYVL